MAIDEKLRDDYHQGDNNILNVMANICECCGNPFKSILVITPKITNVTIMGTFRVMRVRSFNLLGTMNTRTKFHGNPPIVVEIFQSGPKWPNS